MQDIIIDVSEAGTAAARTFAYEITVDGRVAAQGVLTPVQSQQIKEIGSQYFSLWETKEQAESYLPLLRDALGRLFLEKGEQEWRGSVASDVRLVISSSIPEVLQLPWELLQLLPSSEGGLRIVRRPGIPEAVSISLPRPSAGPLRLLFLASGIEDWEEEEKAVLEMAEALEIETVICESGTRQELIELAGQFRPHLLHLAVPVKASPGGAAVSLPDRSGEVKEISAEDLARDLDDSVSGVVLSRVGGSAQAQHLFCQRLSAKMPMAVAWMAQAAVLQPFYKALAEGASLEDALLSPKKGAELSGTVAALLPFPALYSQADLTGPLIDSGEKSVASGFRACHEIRALPGLAEGWTECFVGRRADISRLYPPLREGGVHTLVVTGQAGSGGALCQSISAGCWPMPDIRSFPYSSPSNPITWTRLLELVSHLKAAGQESQAKALIGSKAPKERMNGLIQVLKANRLLLLWDGLELESGRIPDPDLAQFYLMMVRE